MASCKGTISYFCCCADPCGCDGGCCSDCGSRGDCNGSSLGTGYCGTCYTSQRGFAWPCYPGSSCCYGTGSNLSPNCGDTLYFYVTCGTVTGAPRVDVGPATYLNRLADLTKTSFMKLAPLSQGIITGVTASTTSC